LRNTSKDNFPIKAHYYLLRYHLGTVAFGSLLVALCEFLRNVLEVVTKSAKEAGSN